MANYQVLKSNLAKLGFAETRCHRNLLDDGLRAEFTRGKTLIEIFSIVSSNGTVIYQSALPITMEQKERDEIYAALGHTAIQEESTPSIKAF